MIKLINKWDIVAIRNEEKVNAMMNPDIIYATRIIFLKKKYKIECICFKNFFNLKRDIK